MGTTHTTGLVVVANNKGGAGKTTVVLGLSITASQQQPVTVVDLDPQRSTSTWIEDNDLRKHLPLTVLTELPAAISGLVFVDTPRLDQARTAAALSRADLVVVPLRASMMDFTVAQLTVAAVTAAKRRAAWLPSQIDTRRTNDRELPGSLRNAMGEGPEATLPVWPVLPSIRQLSSVPRFLEGRAPSSEAAKDFAAVWPVIKKLLRGGGK